MYFSSFQTFIDWFNLSGLSLDDSIEITIYDTVYQSPIEAFEANQ